MLSALILSEHSYPALLLTEQLEHQRFVRPGPLDDRDLETICARCLERDPKARYQSAAALATDWSAGSMAGRSSLVRSHPPRESGVGRDATQSWWQRALPVSL